MNISRGRHILCEFGKDAHSDDDGGGSRGTTMLYKTLRQQFRNKVVGNLIREEEREREG